jgi:hypothetical protein
MICPPDLLLRAHRERPRSRAAEQRDELTPFHSITSAERRFVPGADICTAAKSMLYSITSSACASSVGGTSSSIVLTAGRLITSSNLLNCCNGRSLEN